MLRQLHITGLGVIGELDIEPAPGLTVLTGETGAGKTMITVGVSPGARAVAASAQLVRSGERAAKIQARFDAPAGAEEWAEDGEVILARTIVADGRGSARIGGQLTTAAALADMGTRLVEIHGQHQSLRLLDGATQTAFLDRYAGPAHVERGPARIGAAYAGLQAARRELEALLEAARDRERELDLLAYQVREIEAVAPQPDESEALHGRGVEARARRAARRSWRRRPGAPSAATAGRPICWRRPPTTSRPPPTSTPMRPRSPVGRHALAAEIAELASEVRAYRERVAVDPARLQEVRERIAALRGLQRKYGADGCRGGRVPGPRAATSSRRSRPPTSAWPRSRPRSRRPRRTVETLADSCHGDPPLGRPGAVRGPHRAPHRPRDARRRRSSSQVGGDREPGPLGADRVELRFCGGPGQPSLALGQGGQRGRAVAGDARVPQRPGRPRRRADARVRRDRRGDRWRGRAGGRATAGPARRHAPGARRDPPAADRLLRRPARPRPQGRRGRDRAEVLDDRERPVELSRMLAGMEASEHALSHAEELLEEAARVRADVP